MKHRVLLALLVLGGAACTREHEVAAQPLAPVVRVRTAVVTAASLPVRQESPATVRPAERATLAAKLAGTVSTFPHALGEAVVPGDVLLTLNAPEAEARVRQARAQLAEAERTADRMRTLVEKGVNAPDTLRDAEDRLRYAQATTAEAEALLSYATVRAPFAGVITEKFLLPGDLATPGLPLLVLESTQHLRAEAAVPEKAAASLRPGTPLEVLLDDAALPVTGEVEELSAAADAVSRTVLVKVRLPADAARSGQFARLLVPGTASEALLVSTAAISRFGQMERVFVITDGHAVLRLVKAGRIAGDRCEVLSGLAAGEQVIVSPPAALREGQPVAVEP